MLQFIITAQNGGSPAKVATASATITVWRNRFQPQFVDTDTYSKTIAFNTQGSVIASFGEITATDADNDDYVSHYFSIPVYRLALFLCQQFG